MKANKLKCYDDDGSPMGVPIDKPSRPPVPTLEAGVQLSVVTKLRLKRRAKPKLSMRGLPAKSQFTARMATEGTLAPPSSVVTTTCTSGSTHSENICINNQLLNVSSESGTRHMPYAIYHFQMELVCNMNMCNNYERCATQIMTEVTWDVERQF